MLTRRVQKIIQEEGLGEEARLFLSTITSQEGKKWGTNDKTLLDVMNKCYLPRGIVEVHKYHDDGLNPPEFYAVRLTQLGYKTLEVLTKKHAQ